MTTNAMEWTRLNKSEWGNGPWMQEPDKMQWVDEATGLDCLIVRNNAGALCGYVGVPESHPWHGVDYSQCLHTPRCEESWCGNSPESHITVHGGLTFADRCNEASPEKWERWRASMLSRRDEAKQYPRGDAANAWRDLGKFVDDYEGWHEYSVGRAICHVPEPGRPDNVWWFGFDCAHSGDLCPGYAGVLRTHGDEWYKDRRYVEGEVRELAAQLARIVSPPTDKRDNVD